MAPNVRTNNIRVAKKIAKLQKTSATTYYTITCNKH